MKETMPLETKQLERKERKKKKLAALANLIKSNDKERQEEVMAERMVEPVHEDEEAAVPQINGNNDDDGFTKVR